MAAAGATPKNRTTQGEVRACASRALAHEKIHDRFMERALARVGATRPTRSILR
jgi:acyl-CoA reductase-like NAD-dependent aldehyde dehydrogenase